MSTQRPTDDVLSQLVSAINDHPTPRHPDHTPAVSALISHGVPGARAVLPLLESEDEWSRRRARRVLEGVVMTVYGWKPGQGFSEIDSETRVADLLTDRIGELDLASAAGRADAVRRWARLLDELDDSDDSS